MSFCCGASMIGTQSTLRHVRTLIHNVPVLFCPVCQRIEVHHLVADEYEILAEYASFDGANEIDFIDFISEDTDSGELFENCVNTENDDPEEVVSRQIDMALDLLAFAKALRDVEWEAQLIKRLHMLSVRQKTLMRKAAGQ